MAVLIQPKWPKTLADLQTCLSTPIGTCTKCQGRSKSKPSCMNPISKESRKSISSVVVDILASGSLSSAARHLERLASLVLCKRWHQTQVVEKIVEWERRIRDFLGSKGGEEKANGKVEPKSEGWKPRTVSCSAETGSRLAKPSNAGRPSVAEDVKTEPVDEKRRVSVVKQEVVKDEDDECRPKLDSIPFNHLLAKSTSIPSPPYKSTAHTFTPYGPPALASKINKDIIEKLIAPFTKEELKAADTGYIYGYRLPKGHTTASGTDTRRMIKIGYTNNPQRRMREWASKCHYTPDLVFRRQAPHYIKMEEVVHLHLANERRWDRGCPGCGGNHKEFFEVDAERAQAVVGMWAAWASLRPFDEEGRLTAYWTARLKALDVDDAECWDTFVLDKGKTKAGSK
ncbi:chitin synthase [Colletotrichum tofieldiae]|nr:chitin synthase [Colletotrichum tofieldiae]GKT68460.1 chitin synthase [Colletotrichum tofieldiae]